MGNESREENAEVHDGEALPVVKAQFAFCPANL